MTIEYLGGSWVAANAYNERQLLKDAGFRWDPNTKTWWSGNPEAVSKVSVYCSREALEALKSRLVSNIAAKSASVAIDADICIPANPGLEYLGYQKAGVKYAAEHNGTLLADDPGLGKTIQVAGLLNFDQTLRKGLIIAPASLKINWQREFIKWLVVGGNARTIGIVNSDVWPDTDIVIINYDLLQKHHARIHATEWDLLVADEAHVLRTPTTIRTREVLGLEKNGKQIEAPIFAKKKVFLTGTPIVNRPIELWGLIHYLCPSQWSDVKKYKSRYCWDDARGDYKGGRNLEELQERLRETVMIRRMKAQVLTQLPAKRRQIIPLQVDDPQLRAALKVEFDEFAIREAHLESVKRAMAQAKESNDEAGYREAAAKLKQGLLVAFSEMAGLRHRTAVAKIPHVIAHLEDLLDSTKVVVFAHHLDVMEAIEKAFPGKCVRLDGGTSQSAKQAAVDRFQNDDTCRLFIGGIIPAGVGITLTASAHVVFAEEDWVPGNLTQAEDRCHRIGQNDAVLVQHLVFDGSLEAYMVQKSVKKQENIDKAMNAKDAPTNTVEHIITAKSTNALTEVELIDKAKAVFSLKSDMDDLELESVFKMQMPTGTPADFTTYQTAYKRLQADAAAKTAKTASQPAVDPVLAAKTPAIHSALQYLAGMCDGARTWDGAGFNKLDTNFGKSLAGAPKLTPKQAAAGLKLVNKYRGQLPQPIRHELGL